MIPTLFIGPVVLPTYPLLLLGAFAAGVWLGAYRAKQVGLDGDHVYNVALYSLLAGLLGARIWFVLGHWENYAANLAQAFTLSRSALSTGEGFIVAGLFGLIYLQRHNLPLGIFFDAISPGLALALIIGHLGAFLGGEAAGLPSTLPWAVEINGITSHPVQLYEAGATLLILVILYLQRTWQPWPGFYFCELVVMYGLAHLLLEIFQAHPYIIGNGYLAGQVVAFIAIIVALLVMAYNFTTVKGQVRV